MSDMSPVPTTGGSALSPASVSGGRRHRMKKVSAKTIKKTLKRLGMKPKGRVVIRGGNDPEMKEEGEMPVATATAGRRRKHTKKTHRRHRKSLFGMRY